MISNGKDFEDKLLESGATKNEFGQFIKDGKVIGVNLKEALETLSDGLKNINKSPSDT